MLLQHNFKFHKTTLELICIKLHITLSNLSQGWGFQIDKSKKKAAL